MSELMNLSSIQITMASPEKIRAWSHGEVTKPETINYRTLKPERDGLYCERIFGPTKDWECNCGKYKRVRNKNIVCEKCGVEVTRSKVRRERMGHIELAAPVSHIWYFKGIPSRIGTLLDISPRSLERVLYFSSYIVLYPGVSGLAVGTVLSENEYRQQISTTEYQAVQKRYNDFVYALGTEIYEKRKDEFDADKAYFHGETPDYMKIGSEEYIRRLRQHEKYAEYQRMLKLKEKAEANGSVFEYEIVVPEEPEEVLEESPLLVGMGAEAIRDLLERCNLELLSCELRTEIAYLIEKERSRETEGQKRSKAIKRLEVVEAFRTSHNKPEWMILTVIPVMPPDLRPMVQLDGGRFATSDLNDLYRRVINRNNRLKTLLQLGAPDIIVRNEKRMLQEAVDALIDNGRRGRPVTGAGNRALKSLSDFLRGKQGRFRQNLLGKRVDYSGRSVIVVGPELKLHQCGLPKDMALELFKPFVMERLVNTGMVHNVKGAKNMVERHDAKVWDILEGVIREHPVLLNRAPTLHRLGIQAFEPILVEGKAIKLHPLACTAFNADFDGDQMAVHVPLSLEAQAEARFLMLCANNILKPQDGKPVISPSQDMVIGCYYLSSIHPGVLGEGRSFANEDEAMMAYLTGQLHLQARINVRIEREFEGKKYRRSIETSLGRLILNSNVPQDMGFKRRETLDDMFELEIDTKVGKKELGKIVDMCFRKHGVAITAQVLDKIKAMGYKYSTIGAVTVSVADIIVPPEKKEILAAGEAAVHKVEKQFKRGLITDEERYNRVVGIWSKTTDDVKGKIMNYFDEFNPIRMMTDSGARGSMSQVSQLAGMRGMMASPTGKPLEMPVKANFREGLTVLEFFQSSHGSRKALSDTAMKTADSGYLTRRLVDVSQQVIIREKDCFASRNEKIRGITVTAIGSERDPIEKLFDRIVGRVAAEDIINPLTGEVIVPCNEMISYDKGNEIINCGIKAVQIRSVLTCHNENGVCVKCYGQDMAHGGYVNIGETVGIVAAQAIGEPGTQLTMRTFHTGGVASEKDITQGLPRVEELFEARRPKRETMLAESAGVISLGEEKKTRTLIITSDDGTQKSYKIAYGSRLKVKDGDRVEVGDELTEGQINPHDLLRIMGVKAVQEHLLKEVLMVYRLQGVGIADKHIEVIVHQMLRKVRVEDAGDTNMLPGSMVDMFYFEKENLRMLEEGRRPAVAKRILLGITKAALATESFLSAASFQETTRVLTEAAIRGKEDYLVGLKENVIIGRTIPAGTGMPRYKDITIHETY